MRESIGPRAKNIGILNLPAGAFHFRAQPSKFSFFHFVKNQILGASNNFLNLR